jgi:hypothetical protein
MIIAAQFPAAVLLLSLWWLFLVCVSITPRVNSNVFGLHLHPFFGFPTNITILMKSKEDNMINRLVKHFDNSMEGKIEELHWLIKYDKEHIRLTSKHSTAFQHLYNRLPDELKSMLFELDGLNSDLCTMENKFFYRKAFWEGASIVLLIMILIVLILIN